MQKNEVYLDKVNKNEDTYAWSELNCFYRAFAIALNSVNDKYYDLFLMYVAAYVAYITNGERNLSFDADDNVLKYYDMELKTLFGTEIKKQDFTSYKDMKKRIFETLADNEVIVIPCDLFYLPYCKTYLELHKRHYLIIKGMNRKKDIFYVLDNMQNELGSSTVYTDFMIKTENVYDMSSSFKACFDGSSSKKYFWSIKIDECSYNEQISEDYIRKLCTKLTNYNLKNSYEYILINKMKQGIFDIDIFEYMEYINIKKLFFCSVLKHVQKNYQATQNVTEFGDRLNSYLKEREEIKILFAATYQKRVCDDQKLEQSIYNLLEKEKQILNKLMTIIDNHEHSHTQNSYSEFVIVNNNNAAISRTDEKFSILLEENKIYDLWKNSNNGVQIYKECCLTNGYINVELVMDCLMGGSSHCGIMLIMENGSRVLFGSLGKLNIAVHELSENPEYELFIENFPFEENLNLEIRFNHDEYCFLADGKKLCELKFENNIKYYGVFAKTWEKCRCKVDFKINESK